MLRAALPALTDPRLERTTTDYDEAAGWLTLRRGPVIVAVNLGTTDWTCPAAKDATLLASSDPRIALAPPGLLLPPDSVAIATTAAADRDRWPGPRT